MSPAKRRKKPGQRRGSKPARISRARGDRPAESRKKGPHEELGAESLTVMWMLTAVATLAAQLVAVAARVAQVFFTAPDAPPVARILPSWFLFCAAVTGLVCLTLTPIVYVMRRRPPPTPVTIATIVICLFPWLLMATSLAR